MVNLLIWPYYKFDQGPPVMPQYNSAPALVNATQGPVPGATKFTFVELSKGLFW